MDVMGQRLIRRFDEDLLLEADRLVRAEWWAATRDPERSRAALRASRLFGLLDVEGRLSAFVRVLDDGAFKALLLDLVVAPGHRGRGLGRAFVAALLATPEMRDIDHVELYCEPALEDYYARFGFSRRAGGALFMRLERRPSPEIPRQERPR